MPCRLILKTKFRGVKHARFFYLDVWFTKKISKVVKLFLGHQFVDKHNGVVEITTFDQVLTEQVFQFTQKNKSSAGSNIFYIIRFAVEVCILLPENWRIEVDQGCDFKMRMRQGS